MSQRAGYAQFGRAEEAAASSDARRRSQMPTAGEDEGLPTWGGEGPSPARREPARALLAQDALCDGDGGEGEGEGDAQPTVIVDGEHWMEPTGWHEPGAELDDDAGGETMVGTVDNARTTEGRAAHGPPAKRISETRARVVTRPDEGPKRASVAPRRRASAAPPPVTRVATPTAVESGPTDVWKALERRFRATGQWTDLVELYLQQIDVARARPEKARLLRNIGAVMRDGLADAAQSLDAFVEALLLEPTDASAVAAVEGLARQQEGWRGLVETVAAQLDSIDLEDNGKERQIALCEHLVRWTRSELGKRDAAQRFIDRIHALDPSHPAIHRRLASVYREHGQWDSQRDALDRALLSARQDGERTLLHVALGELEEQRFGDIAAAAKHYEQALALDPRAWGALNGLERILRTEERFVDLVQVLEKQVEAAASDEARVNALLRVAEVHELHFVKPQHAAPKLEDALALEPSNMTALLALERCYHATRAWTELVRVIDLRITLEPKLADKIALALQIAEVQDSKLCEPQATLRAYRRVFELDDRNVLALTELSRLSERAEDWTAAAAYRARLADLQPNKEQQARMHVTIGEMLAPAHRDPTRSRMHFERAAALCPTNASAWEALERDARSVGDVDRATVYLEKRIAHTEAPRVKAQLLVELGRLHASLGESTSATGAYIRALEADSLNEAAAVAMFAHYTHSGRWAEAQPLCELLVNCAARDGDVERHFELLRTATRIAIELGNDERALVASLAAYNALPRAGAKEDVILVCHRVRGDAAMIARAAWALDAIEERPVDLSPGSLARLAEVRRAGGDEAAAIALLTRALSIDPEHRGALEGMTELFVARQDWERACAYKLKLAHAVDDANDQFVLLVDTGELWAHQAHNLAMAALAYEEALGIRPRDHWLLHTLMWLYGELECWEKLVEILRAVAEVETDEVRKAKSIYAMAQVMRDKLNDLPRAATLFEESLDLDPKRLDAFERVVRIHTELRDWSELKGSYGRMLRRLKNDDDTDLKHALFFQLGLIFRDRVGDAARALDAFRAAERLKPDVDEVRKIVCELLVVTGRVAEAIGMVRAAVQKRPLEAPLYHELYTLFCREGAFDKAWCALDAVSAIGGAMSPEQARFYADYPPVAIDAIPGTLTGVAWRSHVLHADLDPALTAIFAVVAPVVRRVRLAVAPKGWLESALGERLATSSAASGSTAKAVLRAVKDGADVLGIAPPVLHARKGPPLAASMAKHCMFVSVEACEALTPDALAFVVGKHVAEERPELAARAAFPSVTELTALLQTAIYLAQREPRGHRSTWRAGRSSPT